MCEADRVYSFEPRPHVFEILKRNVDLNAVGERVTLYQIGVGEAAGSVSVELDRRMCTFPVDTLDRILEAPLLTSPVPPPGPLRRVLDGLTRRRTRAVVLKIDVEGMELAVLTGATALLEQHRPRVFAEAHTEAEYEALREHLARFRYRPSGRVFNASPTYEFVPA